MCIVRREVVRSGGEQMPERVPVETGDLLVVRVLHAARSSILSALDQATSSCSTLVASVRNRSHYCTVYSNVHCTVHIHIKTGALQNHIDTPNEPIVERAIGSSAREQRFVIRMPRETYSSSSTSNS